MVDQNSGKFELTFVRHTPEFTRFYKNHQKLNEEIAGLREKRYYEFGKEKTITIGRENFWMGIKTLHAYIIDNIHYVKRYDDQVHIQELFETLENDYTSDEVYQRLAEKVRKDVSLTLEEDYVMSTKYLKYLIISFQIAYKLNVLLKPTLMVSIDQKKDIHFREEEEFYLSLSFYRDLMKEDLANFRTQHSFEHLKRILGYCYTYKPIFLPEEIEKMDIYLKEVYELFNLKEVYEYIWEARKGNTERK